MKPDYKNWIPKGMLVSLIAGTVLSFALLLVFGVFGIGVSGKLRIALGVVFGIAFVVCAKCTQWGVHAYRSFSYDGERKLSTQFYVQLHVMGFNVEFVDIGGEIGRAHV